MSSSGCACVSRASGWRNPALLIPFSSCRCFFLPLASDRSCCVFGRPSAPDETRLDEKPRSLAPVSTLFSQHATASPTACVCLRCFLFLNHVSPVASLRWRPILSSVVATSLRPGAPSIAQSRSPAWLSVRHVCPRGYAPSPLARTHPPAWKAICLPARPPAPAGLSPSPAYITETARRLAADASIPHAAVTI